TNAWQDGQRRHSADGARVATASAKAASSVLDVVAAQLEQRGRDRVLHIALAWRRDELPLVGRLALLRFEICEQLGRASVLVYGTSLAGTRERRAGVVLAQLHADHPVQHADLVLGQVDEPTQPSE